MTNLDAALSYARRGWRVIAVHYVQNGRCSCPNLECKSPGKHPIPNAWQDRATVDPAQIDSWWREYPNASVGIVTGVGSGFFAFDVDVTKGADLDAFQAQHGALPVTLTALTGSGGYHVLFKHPGGYLPNSASHLGHGLDIRGDGGFIVAAPSLHASGRRYSWLNPEDQIAEAPAWLLTLIRRPKAATPGVGGRVAEGGRNDALTRLAGRLRAMDCDEAELEAALLAFNDSRCTPPLSESEVRRIALSVSRYQPAPVGVWDPSLDPDPEPALDYEVDETDIGNALRLERKHGRNLRYVCDWGEWLVWRNHRWEVDDEAARRLAQDTAISIQAEVAELQAQVDSAAAEVRQLQPMAFESDAQGPTPEHAAAMRRAEAIAARLGSLRKHAKESRNSHRINAMLTEARVRSFMAIDSSDLDTDPLILGVPNGVLDLQRGTLRAARRRDLLTKSAGTAFNASASCPQWEAFLEQVLCGDAELIAYLQRAVGYSLTGSVDGQVFFFLSGDGANGKSVLINTLLAVLGDYAKPGANSLIEEDRFGNRHPADVADLQGARLVAVTETEEGRGLPEAAIKRLTGGEPLKARKMRQDFFTFAPSHKLWISGNHKPDIRGTDHGIWRRLRIIPFNFRVSKPDPEIGARLITEAEGILAWAVRGCRDYLQGGLAEPKTVLDALEEYKAEQDPIGLFLGERCLVTQGESAKSTDMYAAYKDWCALNGYKYPLNIKRFKQIMGKKGFEVAHTMKGRVWVGVKLLPNHTFNH